MSSFYRYVRREQDYCTRSPKRAFFISKYMRKCLIFFYFTYSDIKDVKVYIFIVLYNCNNNCSLL